MKLEGIVSERMPYFSAALWSLSQTMANLAWFSSAKRVSCSFLTVSGSSTATAMHRDVAGELVDNLLVLGEALLAGLAESAPGNRG